jgi:hypothetical protein
MKGNGISPILVIFLLPSVFFKFFHIKELENKTIQYKYSI